MPDELGDVNQQPWAVRVAATDAVKTFREAALKDLRNSFPDLNGADHATPPAGRDRVVLERRWSALSALLDPPVQPFLELKLKPGWQTVEPPYDYFDGAFAAPENGQLLITAPGNGFEISAIGLRLKAAENGIAAVTPGGYFEGGFFALGESRRLLSRAGAGSLVTLGGKPAFPGRQPLVWDMRNGLAYMGQTFRKPLFNLESIATPGAFGHLPLSPITAPVGPNRDTVVWFYLWHWGNNVDPTKFWVHITSKIEWITIRYGPEPYVG